jgi:hypothetical protein
MEEETLTTASEIVNDIILELDVQDSEVILKIHRMIFGDEFREDQVDWHS